MLLPLLWVSHRAGRGPCLFIFQLSPLYTFTPPISLGPSLGGGGHRGKGKGYTSFDLGCCLPFSYAFCFPVSAFVCLSSSSETLSLGMFLGPGEALGDLVQLPSRASPWKYSWPKLEGALLPSTPPPPSAPQPAEPGAGSGVHWAECLQGSPGKMGLRSVVRVCGHFALLPLASGWAKFRTTGLFLSQLGIWTLLL